MKRIFFGIIGSVLLSSIFIGSASAGVQDFVIRDFQVDYYLNKDSEGRSTLKIVESIAADFPANQNHGIERSLPKSYDNHSTNLSIESVNDQDGNSLNYTTYSSGDNLVLRICDKDTYVSGLNTYVITYYRRDVTKYFSDTKDDEFYWDTNGTDWLQSFDKLSANIHIDQSLIGSINDKQSCYFGSFGSNTPCSITKTETGDGFSISVDNLSAGENVTFAIGFKPKTFAGYQMSESEKFFANFIKIYMYVFGIVSLLAGVLLIWLLYLSKTKGKGVKNSHAIIPEYLPPKNADILLSAVLLKNSRKWVAASFIDFAVRKKIRIIEVGKDGIFSKKSYKLELLSSDKLTNNELEIMKSLFGSSLNIGDSYTVYKNKKDYTMYEKLYKIYKNAKKATKNDGYIFFEPKLKKQMIIIIFVIWFLVILTLFFGLFFGIMSMVIYFTTKPLTQKGRDLVDYLEGLKLYIKVAEEKRLQMLQSPEGAEKTNIDVNDKTAMIKLYEKNLPYAVLFGNEKEWAKCLGEFYEQTQNPDWYSSNGAFNAVMFSSALSSFSSTATSNTYTSQSSSSSGGSGGGGFSGGGGGGGGGGGW